MRNGAAPSLVLPYQGLIGQVGRNDHWGDIARRPPRANARTEIYWELSLSGPGGWGALQVPPWPPTGWFVGCDLDTRRYAEGVELVWGIRRVLADR